MPRDLVIGNGKILVNIDRNLNIRDFYYPHVGLHNHVGGHTNRVGVWADGRFSWVDDSWSTSLGYKPGTLTTEVHASNGRLGIGLRVNDTVHPEVNLFLRRVSVENLQSQQREVRLFFHQDFRIYESDVGDTAFFHPFTGSVVHYKRDCYFLINGRTDQGGVFEYATDARGFAGAEGTWRDAEDGSLSMNPIEQGSVDSTVSFSLNVPAGGSAVLYYWIAVGPSLDEVVNLNNLVRTSDFEHLLSESGSHWESWLSDGVSLRSADFAPAVRTLYDRSLLVLQTHVDRCGGIVAANDTDIMETARAHYSYVRPRDGAMVARALSMAGYADLARQFFSFCAGILPSEQPFFLEKYSPDGTVGAASHPWVASEQAEVPCQQDSTALVIWSLGKHLQQWRSKEFARSIYEDLVVPAANRMVQSIDRSTGLPPPSYDLWERSRGVHLFTCCAVDGALAAAARLSRMFDPKRLSAYSEERHALKRAIVSGFFDRRLRRFVRSLVPDADGALVPDPTVDSSMAGVFLFGVLPARHAKVTSTMEAIYDRLWVQTPVGGLARYEDDCCFQVSSDVKNVPGNPWFISTLWMAEWYIAVARGFRDLEPAMDLLQWAASHASEAGLLAEQIHPFTSQPLAVMPLSWSHAAFVSAVLKYQAKVRELSARKADKA